MQNSTRESHQPSSKWAIKFKDESPPNKSYEAVDKDTNVHYMELKLETLYKVISDPKHQSGIIDTDEIFLV